MSLAAITFHVQDAAGVPIFHAALHAESPHGAWDAVTDQAGNFTAHLSPGHYDLTIAAAGYRTRTLPADLKDPGTITIGLETLVGKLTIGGNDFLFEGKRTVMNGTDAFCAFRQFRDGGAGALMPFVEETHELGFVVWRVFMQGSKAQNQVLELRPTEPGYYDDVRPFVDYLNSQDIIPLITIGVDNQDIRSPIAHWGTVCDLVTGASVIVSFFNEWSKNKSDFNPEDIPAPSGVLWSRGSDVGNEPPRKPAGPVLEFHPVRNYTTAMRDAIASPIELFEVQGYHGPLIIDEPGRMGTNAHDGRFTNPRDVFDYARAFTPLCAGAVMHNFFGQRGQLMDGLTRDCAKAWTEGLRL